MTETKWPQHGKHNHAEVYMYVYTKTRELRIRSIGREG